MVYLGMKFRSYLSVGIIHKKVKLGTERDYEGKEDQRDRKGNK